MQLKLWRSSTSHGHPTAPRQCPGRPTTPCHQYLVQLIHFSFPTADREKKDIQISPPPVQISGAKPSHSKTSTDFTKMGRQNTKYPWKLWHCLGRHANITHHIKLFLENNKHHRFVFHLCYMLVFFASLPIYKSWRIHRWIMDWE